MDSSNLPTKSQRHFDIKKKVVACSFLATKRSNSKKKKKNQHCRQPSFPRDEPFTFKRKYVSSHRLQVSQCLWRWSYCQCLTMRKACASSPTHHDKWHKKSKMCPNKTVQMEVPVPAVRRTSDYWQETSQQPKSELMRHISHLTG